MRVWVLLVAGGVGLLSAVFLVALYEFFSVHPWSSSGDLEESLRESVVFVSVAGVKAVFLGVMVWVASSIISVGLRLRGCGAG